MEQQRIAKLRQGMVRIISSAGKIEKISALTGVDWVGYAAAYADRKVTIKCAKSAVKAGKMEEFMSLLTREEKEMVFHRTVVPEGRSSMSISEEEELALSTGKRLLLVVGEARLFDFIESLANHLRSSSREMAAHDLASYVESYWPHVRLDGDDLRRLAPRIMKAATSSLREKKNDVVFTDSHARLSHHGDHAKQHTTSAAIEADD